MAGNPYRVIKGVPRMVKSVVAFIDILGYQAQTKRARTQTAKNQFLGQLHRALTAAYNSHLKARNLMPREPHLYKVKTFTDNIVIGYPLMDHSERPADAEAELGDVFFMLSWFQLEMVRAGFFLRGGIAVDELYMGEHIVFGNGLLAAYEAESKAARDPRIVLTKSAHAFVKKHKKWFRDPSSSPHGDELLKDADGQFFLNYLHPLANYFESPELADQWLTEHKESVESKLKENKTEPKFWSKYLWAAIYHNYFCDHSKRLHCKIASDKLQLTLGPI